MSDLSQLLVKQNNPITLYLQGENGNVQVGNMLMPTTLNNEITPLTRPRPIITAISGYRVPPANQYSIDVYEKTWAGVYGTVIPQTISTAQADLLVNFTNPTVFGQNYGSFANSTFTLPLSGYYKVNYGLTKIGPAGALESSFRLKIDVDGVDTNSLIFCPLNDGTNGSNVEINQQLSASAFVYVDITGGGQLSLNVQTNISQGSIILINPFMTIELVSPFPVDDPVPPPS
jgi:hypothetical protein